ncbi:hypothetical protein [Vulcanisaeta sp. JCM 16159]|uniref:hypothetical protein n=1 Tax=Vulcanisaeta sp. JCM 16159 TaxID=1295371 RepID=UPI000A8C3FF7|nr:hypothetical protein [Vulcanisaeta sp. JCM 16159]
MQIPTINHVINTLSSITIAITPTGTDNWRIRPMSHLTTEPMLLMLMVTQSILLVHKW